MTKEAPALSPCDGDANAATTWEWVKLALHRNQFGSITYRDRRAHQVLHLLGGYRTAASNLADTRDRFIEAYQLLQQVDEPLRRLSELAGVVLCVRR